VEVGQWVQPPSINTRIRVIQANTPSYRFYVPPYVSSNVVDSDCVVSASVGATVASSPVVDSAIVDSVPVVHSAIVDRIPVDAIVVGSASDGTADACFSNFHACMSFSREGNGPCFCCFCLLLNNHACYSWRKQKFVGEAWCFRGLEEKHVVMVEEFMEGVARRMVEEAEKGAASESEKGVDEDEVEANQVSEDEMEQAFGHNFGFPTTRRPIDYRRILDCSVEPAVMADWLEASRITVGDLPQSQRNKALQLLWTWRDIFCDSLETLPATDLIYHRIPTKRDCKPIRSKPRLSTAEEVAWLHANIPSMEKAGIIDRVDSPWSAPSRFLRKKNNSLRLTHTFCPINEATIKSNYPMRRVEPILNNLMQPRFSMFWWTDAANGYWAVPVWPPHVFKTAFSCALGQFAYKRMGQGLTGAPMTYSRLKDLMAGPIPEPNAEPAISGITLDGSAAFEYFVDDDMGAAVSFEDQFRFLHDSYFPRIAWAKLTLSPAKSAFFMPRVEGLGFVGGPLGLRPSADKVKAIRDYPVPTNEAEIDKFLFMTTYIRKFIPGRAEYARIMKEAVIKVAESIPRSGLSEEVEEEGKGEGGSPDDRRAKGVGFQKKGEGGSPDDRRGGGGGVQQD
jgi:hypothetical protein